MKQYFEFRCAIGVFDPRQLYAAACQRAIEEMEGRVTDAVAIDDLGTADEPDIGACLVMMLDPGSLAGCSIEESWTESMGDE